jgi:hypothetical protein
VFGVSKPCVSNTTRDPCPCNGCPEKFLACSDHCPVDARGGYGHGAWKAEIKRIKKAKQEYLDNANVRKKNYYGGYHGEP